MGLCKLIVIVGVTALLMQSSNAASIGGQDNVCLCTREYNPVCGSNGVTYSNKCNFECEKRTLKDLEIVFNGDCDEKVANEEMCICTREFNPICGTDGTTYSNKCMFKCAQKNNKDLKFVSFGECAQISNLPLDEEIPKVQNLPLDGEIPEVQQFDVACICTREYFPVCASNGQTFSNKCMFQCEQKSNKDLKFVSFGECDQISNLPLDEEIPKVQNLPLDEEIPEVQQFDVACICTREYFPVCASNGKTFSNKCMFNCAKKTNKNLEILSSGMCPEVSHLPLDGEIPVVQNLPFDGQAIKISNLPLDDKVMCMCTYEYSPVCGTDGNTYPNKCSFHCAQKTNKKLELFAVGACDQLRNFPANE